MRLRFKFNRKFKKISIIGILIFCLSINNINIPVNAFEVTKDNFYQYLTDNGLRTHSSSGKAANYNTYKNYNNLVVYGNPFGDFSKGEYRYLGYTVYDAPYTNTRFPNDSSDTRDPSLWTYIDVDPGEDSWVIVNDSNVKRHIRTSMLSGNNATTLTVDQINNNNGLKKTKLLSSPSWKNRFSVFTRNKKSTGIFYATFDGPNIGGATDIEGEIKTQKSGDINSSDRFVIRAFEDYVDVNVTVIATGSFDGLASEDEVKEMTATYDNTTSNTGAYVGTISSPTKTIRYHRSNLSIGENTVTLKGNVSMQSTFEDKYSKNIYKNIKIVVEEKKDSYITLEGEIEPSSIEYDGHSNMTFKVTANAEAFNVRENSISGWKFNFDGTEVRNSSTSTVAEQNFEITVTAREFEENKDSNKEYKINVPITASPILNYDEDLTGNTEVSTFIYEDLPIPPPPTPPTPPVTPIPPTVEILSVDTIEQGQYIGFGSNAQDTDGTIEHYYWGASGLQSSLPLFDTAFIGGTFNTTGEKTISVVVVDNDGLSAFAIKKIKVVPVSPDAELNISGHLKVNRRVLLDISSSKGDPLSELDWSKSEISIVRDDGSVADVRHFGNGKGVKELELLFKEDGKYRIKVKVVNTLGYSDTLERVVNIQPDVEPVAEFDTIKTVLRNPEDNNKAEIEVINKSYSEDDYIDNIKVTIIFDSDNNGVYNEPEVEIYNGSEFDTKSFKVDSVGNYLIKVYVTEGFGQPTIPTFINMSDYENDDTSDKALDESIVEVDNAAPFVDFSAEPLKPMDLIFMVSEDHKLNEIKAKFNSTMRLELLKKGYDLKVEYIQPYKTGELYYKDDRNDLYSYNPVSNTTKKETRIYDDSIIFGRNDIAYYEYRDKPYQFNLHTGEESEARGKNIDKEGNYFYFMDSRKDIKKIPNEINSVSELVESTGADVGSIKTVGDSGIAYTTFYRGNAMMGHNLLDFETGNTKSQMGYIFETFENDKKWYSRYSYFINEFREYDVKEGTEINLSETYFPKPYNLGTMSKTMINGNESEIFVDIGTLAYPAGQPPYVRGIYKFNTKTTEFEFLVGSEYSLVECVGKYLYLIKDGESNYFYYDLESEQVIETSLSKSDKNIIKHNNFQSIGLEDPETLLDGIEIREDAEAYIINIDDELLYLREEDRKSFLETLDKKSLDYVAFTDTTREEKFYKDIVSYNTRSLCFTESIESNMKALEKYITEKKSISINVNVENTIQESEIKEALYNKEGLLYSLKKENIIPEVNFITKDYISSDYIYYRDSEFLYKWDITTNIQRIIDTVEPGEPMEHLDGTIFYRSDGKLKRYNPETEEIKEYEVEGVLRAVGTEEIIYLQRNYEMIKFNINTLVEEVILDCYIDTYNISRTIELVEARTNGDLIIETHYDNRSYNVHDLDIYTYSLAENKAELTSSKTRYSEFSYVVADNSNNVYWESNYSSPSLSKIGTVYRQGDIIPLDNKLYFYGSENGYWTSIQGINEYDPTTNTKKMLYPDVDLSLLYGYNDKLILKGDKIKIFDLNTNKLMNTEYSVPEGFDAIKLARNQASEKENYSLEKLNRISFKGNENNYLIDIRNGDFSAESLEDLELIGLGTTNNEQKYSSIGHFINNNDMDNALKESAAYILQDIENKEKETKKYIIMGETLDYSSFYKDYENDPIEKEVWKINHTNPHYFENSNGINPLSNQILGSPLNKFDYKGEYEISLKAKDNPKDNDQFEMYRKWSNEAKSTVYVHERPIALFDVDLDRVQATYYDKSYDNDHLSEADKGIIQHKWYWKEKNEEHWHYGKLDKPIANTSYVFKLQVKDKEGAWGESIISKDTSDLQMPIFEVEGDVQPRETTPYGTLNVSADIKTNTKIISVKGYFEEYNWGRYSDGERYEYYSKEEIKELNLISKTDNVYTFAMDYKLNGVNYSSSHRFNIIAINEYNDREHLVFNIKVTSNNPPRANIINIKPNQKYNDSAVTFDVNVSDPDDSNLNLKVYYKEKTGSYTLLGNRDTTNGATTSWTLPGNLIRNKDYDIKAVVSDGKTTGQDIERIHINNRAPTVQIGTLPTRYAGESMPIAININDQDNDLMNLSVYYKHSSDSSFKLLQSNTNLTNGNYNFNIGNLIGGDYEIKAIVDDSLENNTDRKSFYVEEIQIFASVQPNPSPKGGLINLIVTTKGGVQRLRVTFDNRIQRYDNNSTINKTIMVEPTHIENIEYLLPLEVEETLDENSRVYPGYNIVIEGYKDSKMVSTTLVLDVYGNIFNSIKTQIITDRKDN